MAKPPEPLQEVLPLAAWVVDAEVVAVLKEGVKPPPPMSNGKLKAGATSRGVKAASQTIKLKINRVLFGTAVKELIVEKPVAGYALMAGNKGPFLIDKAKNILGRYGPDSYAFAKIEAALNLARSKA